MDGARGGRAARAWQAGRRRGDLPERQPVITLLRPVAPSPRLVYSLSPHARKRLAERTTMSEQAMLDAFADCMAVQLNRAENHFEGCVYELFFSLPDKQFFVAVTKPLSQIRGGIVVTVLTAVQHESDRGPILPALLLQAVRNFTSDTEFEGVAAAARDRLSRLAETAEPGGEGSNHSALPVFSEAVASSTGLARGTLVRTAKILLDDAGYARYCAILAGQCPDSMRPNQVRVLVHYWDAQHNAQCLRLSNPKVPQQHLLDHGLAAVNRHPAFWTWLAGRFAALGIDPGLKIDKLEAYLSVPHKANETVELDLEATMVDDPAPYPTVDFSDSTPEPAAC
ncbi:hypothetical protein Mpe_B0114 (plasmid) [Methylibium petroleiphilum PM1]|uniref:Uncharacterized protein n=1 Tax=Methylibium petroleiphilum (strain ATCC BAA-1232 / LMG 22953 / PM1) TaxID=420662 RepID=A2SMV4_METPP|nr:hypothetical protein Mpe_B0114 [Methylibium petroleiphilum PM1]